jgi:hypothetical protein
MNNQEEDFVMPDVYTVKQAAVLLRKEHKSMHAYKRRNGTFYGIKPIKIGASMYLEKSQVHRVARGLPPVPPVEQEAAK